MPRHIIPFFTRPLEPAVRDVPPEALGPASPSLAVRVADIPTVRHGRRPEDPEDHADNGCPIRPRLRREAPRVVLRGARLVATRTLQFPPVAGAVPLGALVDPLLKAVPVTEDAANAAGAVGLRLGLVRPPTLAEGADSRPIRIPLLVTRPRH